MKPVIDYRRYRWFFTASGKLVYGGKSAEQNEEVLRALKKEYVLMHTQMPGSPFAVIDAPIEQVNASDLEECAIWTASFSRAWREGLSKVEVDLFTTRQIFKKKNMKTGTWGVAGPIQKKTVSLGLVLARQEGILRCIPEKSIKRKADKLLMIAPGNTLKEEIARKLAEQFHVSIEEALQALPTGEFKIVNYRSKKQ